MAKAKVQPLRPPRPCPICGRPQISEQAPFCSARCRQLDLGRWLDGAYRLPSEEEPSPEELAAALMDQAPEAGDKED